MNRRWIFLLILLSLIVAISGCADTDPEQASVTSSATPTPTQEPAKVFPVQEALTVYVTIKGTMFDPLDLEITSGTTVKWTNMDSGQYKVNVSGSQSPLLNKRDTWGYTFNKTGIYEYGCDLHPFMPHGRITVI